MSGDYVPHELCRHYETEADIYKALAAPTFDMPLPDAIDLVNQYGVAAVEGALVKTVALVRNGTVKKSARGFLCKTLSRGIGWSAQQVTFYVADEWEKGLAHMKRSEDPTIARLAREIETVSGKAPENVSRIDRRVS